MSGDAITTPQAEARKRQGEAVWAQCSLSAARNLLRREDLPASFLAERQMGMQTGELDVAQQGVRGDIRFPDWTRILAGELKGDEVFVRFNPTSHASELLHGVRMMAMVFLANTHVVAVHCDELGGRLPFRKYDNDSSARRRGTYECVSARQLWVPGVEMWAITKRNSNLHEAVGNVPPAGSLTEQRRAELASVLGQAGLGHLLPALHKKAIRSLNALLQKTVQQLQLLIGRRVLSAEQWRQLGLLGLRRQASGDGPAQAQMRRD